MDPIFIYWKNTIEFMMHHVKYYEDPSLQQKALECVPKAEIVSRTSQRLKEMKQNQNGSENSIDKLIRYEKIYLEELVLWFRGEFFEWFTAPFCCKQFTKYLGAEKDEYNGVPVQVEYYMCQQCFKHMILPRLCSPNTLLRVKTGRTREWAQCFAMICTALGWEARYIQDITDHVWNEIYSHLQRRWIHIDCCEGIVDQPLIYELGWKKKISYVLAFSPSDIQDVTWRYSSDHSAVQQRRSRKGDGALLDIILATRRKLQSSMPKSKQMVVNLRIARELVELMIEPTASGTYKGRPSPFHEWRRNEIEDCTKFSHVWTPSPTELISKEMKIMLNLSSNSYQIGRKQNFDWDTLTYAALNVIRKVDVNRKKSYLTKIENVDEGIISWKVNVSKAKLLIDKVHINCPMFAVERGVVCWAISKVPVSPIGDSATCDKGTTFSNREDEIIPPLFQRHICNIAPSSTTTLYYFDGPSFTVTLDEDVNNIFISVALLEGNQWPKAQIFVQDMDCKEFVNGFIVHLK